jgi:CP family cyanate transporter-like MFS transporter
VTRPWAYAATALASLAALIGMVTTHGIAIVVFAGVLGFTNALTLTLALALPSLLSAPDDVHRTSAGMFTISYSCAMLLSIVGGWLWDVTHMPIASFAPVALCAIVIAASAPTVKNARQ